MKAIIIGYGSAGRRHAKLMRKFVPSVEIVAVDPVVIDPDVLYVNTGECLLKERRFDIAVIATPPNEHLTDIAMCVTAGTKAILCEKPLCGFGQLEQARLFVDLKNVAVALNYRWHPEIKRVLEKGIVKKDVEWVCYSDQQRTKWPAWTIELDHLTHTFDTLCVLAGGQLTIDSAQTLTQVLTDGYRNRQVIRVTGKTFDNNKFMIVDDVHRNEVKKTAWIIGPYGVMDFTKDVDTMFENMWASFLHSMSTDKPFAVNIKEALYSQTLLEEAHRIMVKTEVE